jgi:hypothetical protein
MHTLLGAALSLLLLTKDSGYIGPNGFDPSMMVVLKDAAGDLVSDPNSPDLETWLKADGTAVGMARRVRAVGYFVACAFDRDTVIKVGPHSWPGALALAPKLQETLQEAGSKGKPLVIDPEDGKWVSACLMAFANMAGSHEYVWLRGNPPAWKSAPLLLPAVRWTMGYPEGVFFADLLNFNAPASTGRPSRGATVRPPTVPELEQSFTLSLNLPIPYAGLAQDRWAPPNASNGRTLDFDHVTSAPVHPVGHYHVAENLGAYLAASGNFVDSSPPTDPNYRSDLVCVGADRAVVSCKTEGAAQLRPLFALAPRVVSLASATRSGQPPSAIHALDVGGSQLSTGQREACLAGVACSGPFKLNAVGEAPSAPEARVGRVLTGLAHGQTVEVALRFDADKEGFTLGEQDLRYPFTALILFQGKAGAGAQVQTRSRSNGSWVDTHATWSATGSDWEWLQIYPVWGFMEGPVGKQQAVLQVRISGEGKGEHAPVLDLAGFIVGPPWCLRQDKSFAAVCRDSHDARASILLPMIRLPAPEGGKKTEQLPPKAK